MINRLMRITLAILFIMLGISNSYATHIVGGEFELIHIEGFRYKLRLIQYFDVVNGSPGAEDESVIVYIYRNSDNEFMRTAVLPKVERSLVEYTQIQCAIGQLVTRRLVYETEITLPPEDYDDPEGYHISFERCCRNNVVTNVFLPFPNSVGQTWTLDFPPVVKDGEQFINSSPILFPPLSDYACVGQLYYFDFAGFDPDGDSVAYTLVTPYNSSTTQAFPIPQPKPHEDIPWAEGISIDNVIPGDPVLHTTIDGFLSVKPSTPGLYVFALLAEEFRDGEKIGEVRRDFQMLVIDCPGPNYAPEANVKKKNAVNFHNENNILHFDALEDKCFDLFITDQNSFDPDNVENIKIEVEALNFEADLSDILSDTTGSLDNNSDTLQFEVCLPECPYLLGQPFEIRFIAKDETCPLPLMDTLDLSVTIDPIPTQKPYYTDEFMNPLSVLQVFDTLKEGDIFEMTFYGKDEDNDSLFMVPLGENFDLDNFGMMLQDSINEPGWIVSNFFWDTGCDANNFGLFNDFKISILLEDLDSCLIPDPQIFEINLHVILPTNNDPEVTTSLNVQPDQNNRIELGVGILETINFDVLVDDIDDDFVFLDAMPAGEFEFNEVGMSVTAAEGKPVISSPFSWTVDCNLYDPDGENQYQVYFIGRDQDRCKIPNADTLTINFRIKDPLNSVPQLSFVNFNENEITVKPGATVDLDLLGVDNDNDNLSLDLLSFSEKLSQDDFLFSPASGTGSVTSNFLWVTDCALFSDSLLNTFEFTFTIQDDFCVSPNGDTLRLTVILEDPQPDYDNFTPPNVFTPNGDLFNEEFFIDDLPEDNCDAHFIRIRIFNRWGKLVFADSSRDFRWDGDGMATGVYYYSIEYSNGFEYKGIVSILY